MISIYAIVDRHKAVHHLGYSTMDKEELKDMWDTSIIKGSCKSTSLISLFFKEGQDAYKVVVMETLEPNTPLDSITERVSFYKANRHLVSDGGVKGQIFAPKEKLRESDRYIVFPRETVSSSFNNRILTDTAREVGLDTKTAIEIIKAYSLFIVHCMSNLQPVRMPVLGAFKIFRGLAGKILGEEYQVKRKIKEDDGTICAERRTRSRLEQGMDTDKPLFAKVIHKR